MRNEYFEMFRKLVSLKYAIEFEKITETNEILEKINEIIEHKGDKE